MNTSSELQSVEKVAVMAFHERLAKWRSFLKPLKKTIF
jgi:hypothetical protein